MSRYRFTTLPTGAKKNEWRETAREAKEDAVAAGRGQIDGAAPDGIQLDLMIVIEQDASGLSERELWACAAETLKQHGDGTPAYIADRIGAVVLDGDMAGAAAWNAIASRIDQRGSRPSQPS